MRAAIDIGSNSIRLATEDGTVRSAITKLADGISDGTLSPDGVQRTIAVLKDFKAEAGACDITAFATEAVRRAADGREFCERVKREVGLDIRVLSGEDEARLALLGAKKPAGAALVCDLGGGSMELVSSHDGKTPDKIASLPLGVVVLKNKYGGDYKRAIAEADALVKGYGDFPAYPLTISGGSVCSIAAGMLELSVYDKSMINGLTVTVRELDDMFPILLSKDLAIFRPVCKKRADTIPYGAIIIRALVNHLGLDRFTVSDSGNLDAVLNGAIIA